MKASKTLLSLAVLAAGSSTAAYADDLINGFRVTHSSVSRYGVSVGTYSGSFDGVNYFDVFCVDYLHDTYGKPYSVYQIGSLGTLTTDGSLARSRLGVVHGDVGTDHTDNYTNYLKAAYLANELRVATNAADPATIGGLQLALWWFTAAEANGLTLNPTAEEDIGNGLKSRYAVDTDGWMAYRDAAINCIDFGIGCSASWDPSRWYLLSDARWSDSPLCYEGTETQECKQEFLAYLEDGGGSGDVVPEPATMGLLGIGLVLLSTAGVARRRKRS
jgi:hypothetical protein